MLQTHVKAACFFSKILGSKSWVQPIITPLLSEGVNWIVRGYKVVVRVNVADFFMKHVH